MRKAIASWESLYEVSDAGEIYSLARCIIRGDGTIQNFKARTLTAFLNSSGYPTVRLSRPGLRKILRVHRLVAQTFIANPGSLPEVNHLDGDRTNPCVANLEWCTASQNRHHAYHVLKSITMPKTGKLNYEIAQAMRKEHIPGIYGYRRIARKYGVTRNSAGAILANKSYPVRLPGGPAEQGEQG